MRRSASAAALSALLCFAACSQSGVTAGWGNTDIQYAQDAKPENLSEQAFKYPAWKSDKATAEAVIWTENALEDVTVAVTALRNGGNFIPEENVKAELVGYVMGDNIDKRQFGQCGQRANKAEWDSLMVADIIGVSESVNVAAQNAQPVWLSVKVPADAVPGTYKGKLVVRSRGGKVASLPFSLEVQDELLPDPKDWSFHLDLWQNPYAVARYFGVELWSEEHFAHLRPVMELLASAGQKVITTTILDRPWHGQTEDPFGSMVTKTLGKDGKWSYDYTVFDKWVEFMMSCGIDRQINCYSMIPWSLDFDYFDEAADKTVIVHAAPGSVEYNNYWGGFIYDFAKHLREKGWFDKTMIAMDERPKELMEAAMSLIQKVEPEMKVALAGNYHEGISEDISDLCITLRSEYPEGVVDQRRAEGKISTIYTCCAEQYPNTFIASNPAEASWIGWTVLSRNLDGYLRWAFNSWTVDPMKDARFRTWPAGDCYMVYPDGRSSIHFEKLSEGIRDYEKARILISRWEAQGETDRLQEMSEALARFNFETLGAEGPEKALAAARQLLY